MPETTVEAAPTEPAQDMMAGEGQLAPLNMNDPEAIASELSDAELLCVSGVAGTDDLLTFFASPEQATPDQQAQLLNCLEDETVTRMFLTGLIGDTGPLSVETSACINAGMAGTDLRTVMMSGVSGDDQAAMMGAMSSFFLAISCLNEEEFERAGPVTGMAPSDRESLQCVMEQLGGPEGMAETLGGGDEGAIMAFLGAAIGCGLSIEGQVPSN